MADALGDAWDATPGRDQGDRVRDRCGLAPALIPAATGGQEHCRQGQSLGPRKRRADSDGRRRRRRPAGGRRDYYRRRRGHLRPGTAYRLCARLPLGRSRGGPGQPAGLVVCTRCGSRRPASSTGLASPRAAGRPCGGYQFLCPAGRTLQPRCASNWRCADGRATSCWPAGSRSKGSSSCFSRGSPRLPEPSAARSGCDRVDRHRPDRWRPTRRLANGVAGMAQLVGRLLPKGSWPSSRRRRGASPALAATARAISGCAPRNAAQGRLLGKAASAGLGVDMQQDQSGATQLNARLGLTTGDVTDQAKRRPASRRRAGQRCARVSRQDR